MSRKNIIYTNQFPYHITARTNNKEDFPCPLETVWRIMCDQLAFVQKRENLEIHAFVLMKNHFHLLASTPNANISRVMYWLMKHATLEIQKSSDRINRIFGGRYKASLIANHFYYQSALAYIFNNPLRAGIETTLGNYPYSTFTVLDKGHSLPFAITTMNLFEIHEKAFDKKAYWIDKTYSDEELNVIKTGLRRKIFKDPNNILSSIPLMN